MCTKITWEEMKKTYPNEWLLITDFELDETGQHVVAGVIERHSSEMEEVARLPAIDKPTAFRYTGESTFQGLRSHAQHYSL